MPPRDPRASPQLSASSCRGRTPADTMTMSTSRTLSSPSSLILMPVTPLSPLTTSSTLTPQWTTGPNACTLALSMPPASASSCTGIRCGAISRMCVSSFKSYAAFAASKPSKPPPMTAAFLDLIARSIMAKRSSKVLYTKTPLVSVVMPGVGGTKGLLPVAITRSSYVTDPASPVLDAYSTFLAVRSILVACPKIKFTPLS
mmetsp:Transcript_7876/g.17356  ORF Transcript_7876/g.17356 Transcript_7876/m.17356 type:complete len:201 (+) Transcript_7876:1834-2436(+)